MTIDYQLGLPARMKALPLDDDGHPVPFFVQYVDGKPDFRIMDYSKLVRCIQQNLCLVCGESMGDAKGTFVIGPMCAVNRTSAEPPGHSDCAIYSATHCPFLITPRRKPRYKDLPEVRQAAGIMIERNPGVTLVWTSQRWKVRPVGNGILFDIGEPVRVRWYHEGRLATREEVNEAIESGLPTVREAAELQGPEAIAEFERRVKHALAIVVASVPPSPTEQPRSRRGETAMEFTGRYLGERRDV